MLVVEVVTVTDERETTLVTAGRLLLLPATVVETARSVTAVAAVEAAEVAGEVAAAVLRLATSLKGLEYWKTLGSDSSLMMMP